jgi:hypothetical protein
VNDAVATLFVAVLLIGSLPGLAAAGAGSSAPVESAPADASLGAVAADGSNETVRHQNPEEYDGEADDEELESWLSDSLSSQLQDGSVALSEGEYDLARDALGDDYDERLEQYAEVSGETDGPDDEENDTEEAYRSAAEDQERLADLVEEYEETQAAYEEARNEGDDQRAHELARDLEELYYEIEERSDGLVTSYETIGEETGTDFSESAESVEQTRSDVESDQSSVRDQQFVETELVLETPEEPVSFDDPLVTRGEVQVADGSTVEPADVQLLVDGEPVEATAAETDEWWEDGGENQFEFEYRPTVQELETETLTVQYVPSNESALARSETDLDVQLEQTEPTISNLETTESAAYGDELRIDGEIDVDGVPVDGVPLAVSIDGEHLGTLNATDGSFGGTGELPANVSAGEGAVEVSLPFEDQALASTSAESPISIDETDTELEMEATAIGEDRFAIDGQFAGADGDGFDNESIEVRVDGTAVGTVTTGPDGEFNETVAFPETTDDEVSVTATYEGAGTNLAAAESETTVAVPGGGSSALDSVPPSALAVLGALAVVLVLTAAGWWRRRGDEESTTTVPDAVTVTESDSEAAAEASRETVDALLGRARDQLAEGRPDTAIRSCYAAVRHARDAGGDESGGLTHWEFYRAHADGSDETTDRLRRLTEAYEQAAFTPDPVPGSLAARVFERARQLCEPDGESDEQSGSELSQSSND